MNGSARWSGGAFQSNIAHEEDSAPLGGTPVTDVSIGINIDKKNRYVTLSTDIIISSMHEINRETTKQVIENNKNRKIKVFSFS